MKIAAKGLGKKRSDLFQTLEQIHHRPKPFEMYTAADLWTDEHRSKQMLTFHLDPRIDISSRKAEFIDRSVDWIADHFSLGQGTAVADFGCGPGLYASRLARTGSKVTGIDFSKNSIEYARLTAAKENLSVNYVHQDYLELEAEDRFNLIVMIMCDFCALSPSQRKTMLGTFRSLLAPGGAILLDVYGLCAFEKREESSLCGPNLMDGFWSSNDYYGFLNTFKYGDAKVVLDKYTIVEKGKTTTVYNWLQYFSPETLEREFQDAGLEIQEWYADVAGNPFDPSGPEFAVVAGKK